MSFLDNLTKKVSQGVERAKFEADKIQRTLKLENELGELKKHVDNKRLEFGDRALELYRAGMIQSPTLGSILREIEGFQQKTTLKEEELKLAQAEQFVEPGNSPMPTAQSVPVSVEPAAAPGYTPPAPSYTPPPAPSYTPPAAATQSGTKNCPNCQFEMPTTAVFCPNCGMRISG
jgi:zinc-ribbon domain